MDARDRLRRYLEQRRELGESEFVLDGLPVDDVLKLVGARHASAPRARAEAPPPASKRSAAPAPSSDPIPAPYAGAEAEPTPVVLPPPAPERRFAESASTDWRETLTNAGAARQSPPPASSGNVGGAKPGGGPAGAEPSSSPRLPASTTAQGTPAPVAAALPAWLEALGIPAGLEAGRVQVAELSPEVAALPTLEEVAASVAGCTACPLHKTAKRAVPGVGNPQAEFLCVGEAPGAHEDEEGLPFVGEAGQLLTKILGAIQLSRDDVFICNVLKHRPPANRDPLPDEVLACQPYLLRQIELVRPRVILALGRFAAQTLLQTTAAIGALRGKVHRLHGVPLIVTYHPAALLRNESWKRPTWEDVKLARRILDASRAAERGTE